MMILVFLFCSSNSEAAFLLEPYLGYQSASTSLKIVNSGITGNAKLDTSGLGGGIRIGGTVSKFFLALDYSTVSSKPTVKEITDGFQVIMSGDLARASLGATAGFDLMLFRPYVGYISTDAMGLDSVYVGSGFKAGVGIKIFSKLRLNVEYQSVTYDKSRSSSGTETELKNRTSGIKEVTFSGIFAGLSVPFEL